MQAAFGSLQNGSTIESLCGARASVKLGAPFWVSFEGRPKQNRFRSTLVSLPQFLGFIISSFGPC